MKTWVPHQPDPSTWRPMPPFVQRCRRDRRQGISGCPETETAAAGRALPPALPGWFSGDLVGAWSRTRGIAVVVAVAAGGVAVAADRAKPRGGCSRCLRAAAAGGTKVGEVHLYHHHYHQELPTAAATPRRGPIFASSCCCCCCSSPRRLRRQGCSCYYCSSCSSMLSDSQFLHFIYSFILMILFPRSTSWTDVLVLLCWLLLLSSRVASTQRHEKTLRHGRAGRRHGIKWPLQFHRYRIDPHSNYIGPLYISFYSKGMTR